MSKISSNKLYPISDTAGSPGTVSSSPTPRPPIMDSEAFLYLPVAPS